MESTSIQTEWAFWVSLAIIAAGLVVSCVIAIRANRKASTMQWATGDRKPQKECQW